MFEEFVAGELGVLAVLPSEDTDEADGGGIGRDDPLVQFAQGEPGRQGGHVKAGVVRQPDADGFRGNVGDQAFLVAGGFGLGFRDDDLRRPQDADLLRIAPLGDQSGIHVGALFGHQLDALAGAKHVIDELRGSLDTALRSAGLNQDWPALRRWWDAERAFDLEEPADMVDRPHFRRVRNDTGPGVPDERIGIDAGPELLADVHELFHPVVALAVLDQLIKAVILKIRLALRGDDVERDASVGDVVQGVEQPGNEVRMHEGGGIGEAEADMAGHPGHRGYPRAHVQARPSDAAADGGIDGAFPGVRDPRAVAEEDQVEQAAFGDAGKVFEQSHIGVALVDPRGWLPPVGFDLGPGKIERQMNARLLCGVTQGHGCRPRVCLWRRRKCVWMPAAEAVQVACRLI